MDVVTRRDALRAGGKVLLGVPLAGLVLMETGCKSDVTALLESVVDATQAAVDIAFPQYAALLDPYFLAVTTFIDQVDTELDSSDPVSKQIEVIVQDAAAIIAPNLAGVAAKVVAKVEQIAPLIADLVADVEQLTAAITTTPGGADAFFAKHGIKRPSKKDLARIRKKNAALRARLNSGTR